MFGCLDYYQYLSLMKKLLYILLSISLLSSCQKEPEIIWKVSYVNTNMKQTPKGTEVATYYYFSCDYYSFVESMTDSTIVIKDFHKSYNDGYVVYECYQYQYAKDWGSDERITYRSTFTNPFDVCLELGLIDENGDYIN